MASAFRWVRDHVDMYAFHIDVPQDATSLDANFQYLAPIDPKHGRISSKFADVTWNSVLLYPAGYFSRDIKFETSIRLPEGWKFACALDMKSQDGNLVQFKETTLNTLIDSPLYAGANFKRVDCPAVRTIPSSSISSPTSRPISRSARKSCNSTRIW